MQFARLLISSMSEKKRISYVYGPVSSWRSGNSLGIDPIGELSTCSFNCSYCQLGQIQNISSERKIYVQTKHIIEDLENLYQSAQVDFNQLDVITFAGSGEPTLALNLGEMILAIKEWLKKKQLAFIPISILTNATLLKDKQVREDLKEADLISLKLDASDELSLKSINQAAPGINLTDILTGIKLLKAEIENRTVAEHPKLQLQIMFLPKFAENPEHVKRLAGLIRDLGIFKIQINTPTRAKPKSGKDYWLETRGNHYADNKSKQEDGAVAEEKYMELPVISKELAFKLEEELVSLILSGFSDSGGSLNSLIGENENAEIGVRQESHDEDKRNQIEIINVYKR